MTDRSLGEHRKDKDIAKSLMINSETVGRTRKRFVTEGIEAALYDKPRPGRVPKITGDIEAKLTVLACSNPPEGHSRWTLRLLADRIVELGYVDTISHVAIRKCLKKVNSNPGK